MTENSTARAEAIQGVVDRVSSYQDGAPGGTVEAELRSGFEEAGIDVSDGDVATLAAAIESEHGSVRVTDVLPQSSPRQTPA